MGLGVKLVQSELVLILDIFAFSKVIIIALVAITIIIIHELFFPVLILIFGIVALYGLDIIALPELMVMLVYAKLLLMILLDIRVGRLLLICFGLVAREAVDGLVSVETWTFFIIVIPITIIFIVFIITNHIDSTLTIVIFTIVIVDLINVVVVYHSEC